MQLSGKGGRVQNVTTQAGHQKRGAVTLSFIEGGGGKQTGTKGLYRVSDKRDDGENNGVHRSTQKKKRREEI